MAKAPALGGGTAVDLDADVFEQPFNGPLVHEVVVAELAARRQGTHSTKTRGMVSGGGVAFAPKPRHYVSKVNRKARRAALRSALSLHAGRGSLGMADPSALDAPSTKQAAAALGKLEGEGRVLLVCGGEGEETVTKSFRNLSGLQCKAAADVGVADVVGAARLVLTPGAADYLTKIASKA